jgi:hypothetical protein
MERQDKFMEEHKMTYEQLWQSAHMAHKRQEMGEEYTKEKIT